MRKTKHWLMTIAVLLCSMGVSAQTFEVNGIYYSVTSSVEKTVSVKDRSSSLVGDIEIPATVTYNEMVYSVASIGLNAFRECSSLTSVTIPEGVTSIESYAFYNCTGLVSVTISGSVTYIGDEAFYYCKNLTSITIPENSNLTQIGSSAFYGTTWYNNQPDGVIYAGKVLYCYKGVMAANTFIEVEEGMTSICPYAFSDCSSLVSITIPESVTSIGDYAFSGCNNLASITIPEGVTSVGTQVFEETAWYNNQPDGVIYAGKLLYIYKGAMPENTVIEVKEGTVKINSNAFSGCSNLASITIPEGVKYIGSSAFRNCSSLTSIIIPESISSIGSSAFRECGSLTSIIIPESVTSIGAYTFYGCKKLTSITLPEGVTSIGNYAFCDCDGLTSITLPESVTSIGKYAFFTCGNLTSITIPEGVTSIGMYAFQACSSLTDIYCYAKNVPSTESDAFASSPIENATLHVPASALEAYSTTAPWSGFGNIVALASDDVAEEDSYELVDGRIFMANGDVYEIDSTDDGISPEAPEKEGYTFAEWRLADDEKITEIDIKNNADAMLYSNAPCITDAYGDQFVGWHVLFDGDDGTFFHSDYSGVDSEDGLDHYLRVDMGEGKRIKKFTFTYTVRGDNTPYYTPKRIVVEGSNEANGEYTEITVLTNLPKIGGRVYESGVLGNGNAYRYIRYRVTETDYNNKVQGHPYFYFAEFGMEKVQEVYHAVYTPNPVSDITLTINQYGSGTYCSEYALDFSEVEGLKAYVAAGYNSETGVVTLLRVMSAKAGVGLFVKGEPGDYVVPVLENTSYNALNLLVGTLEETIVNSTDGSYTNYKYTIREDDAEPMFYPFADASTQAAGRAYLQIPTAWLTEATAKSISYRFDEGDGTTDIDNSEFTIQNSEFIYDLMGRRVANPTKGGIYIVNGKKVIR